MRSAKGESSDEMLMVRYRRGDQGAFVELVRRYERSLFNFSLRYLRQRHRAEEVTQEAFLRVVRRAGDFKHESKFSTWIFSIARNLCIDELRRGAHRAHASLDAKGADERTLYERIPAETTDGEVLGSGSRLRESIGRAVESLPDEQREVFLLRQLAGLSFAEIATITSCPENTVKSRMRYALERLQKELSTFEEYARALR